MEMNPAHDRERELTALRQELARMQEVVAELARYRPGILRCDPAVADLKVSGVFSLRDTDEALEAISDSFPVQVRRHTRYWVTVLARPGA